MFGGQSLLGSFPVLEGKHNRYHNCIYNMSNYKSIVEDVEKTHFSGLKSAIIIEPI